MNYKLAMVTGASSGIGLAIAERLASEGVSLLLVARRKDRLDKLAGRLSAKVPCHVESCDLTDSDAVRAMLDRLPEPFGQPDILINNAGLALGLAPAHEADWDDWQRMINTNCTSLVYLTRQILPGMVDRGRGHVVNMGSVAGSYPYPGANVYGASKAFVEQFSLNLKADLVGTPVRVTNIEPGLVSGSEFSLVRFKGDQQKSDAVYQNIDSLVPEDIAESVAWALSQPEHVNINRIEIMPTSQASSGFKLVYKDG